jgi:enterobactin synthetase component D
MSARPTITELVLGAGHLGPGAQGAERLRTLVQSAPHPPCAGAVGIALQLPRLAEALDVAQLEGLPPGIAASVPRRRLSFVAGRLCAEQALRRLGITEGVGRGAAGEPLWPAGMLGSITHTDVTACALVAACDPAPGAERRIGLGIDSQTLVDEGGLAAVVSVCCTPRERGSLLDRFALRDRGLAATVVFALKEAFYKAVHPTVARFVDFDELEVRTLDLDAGSATLAPALPELPAAALLEGRFTIVDDEVHALVELHRA